MCAPVVGVPGGGGGARREELAGRLNAERMSRTVATWEAVMGEVSVGRGGGEREHDLTHGKGVWRGRELEKDGTWGAVERGKERRQGEGE